ncbi:MAG TPA: acetylglutamate kinase [Vicinamibacterales bacterium]|jgi:acetylglutamate kinase|nr:acetylglutamate kinase [Vicinamibacterales bacterium]
MRGTALSTASTPTVLKIGGELVETDAGLAWIAAQIVRLSAGGPLVVVHGGGRSIDAELARRGIAKKTVDGLRVTDAETLDAVLCVLAGRVNTRLVAAVGGAGGRAVGLTGADAGVGPAEQATPLEATSGARVDLGMVGEPKAGDGTLLRALLGLAMVPVVASIGMTKEGRLLNVNADTFAAGLAASLGASELIVAGATPGVLDEGKTIASLDGEAAARLIAAGGARDGMVAKLSAALAACAAGVGRVRIIDGRGPADLASAAGTTIGR